MSVIMSDSGFATDDWSGGFHPIGGAQALDGNTGIDIASDANPLTVLNAKPYQMVRIDFPSFADGRGFTIAAILRRAGYTGRLRAKGHILADQYAMARRSGFDEVEIDDALAARQPEDQWLARANWQSHNYQARLRG